MKKYIGQELLICSGGHKMKGVLIDDLKDRVILSTDGYEVVFAKNRISYFITKNGSKIVAGVKKSGLDVYGYFDKNNKDLGKYYISNDDKNPEEVFSKSCKINKNQIRKLGDLFELPLNKLKEILGGMILGDD